MKKKRSRTRNRNGSGCVYKHGRYLWIKWREPMRQSDGTVRNVVKYRSTQSEDPDFAQKELTRELNAAGGRRATDADPKKYSYIDMRDNYLDRCVAKNNRSIIWRDNQPTLKTIPRLDHYFDTQKAANITTEDIHRFRAEGKREGLSDARLNRYVATLRAMFRWAGKCEKLSAAEIPAYFPMVKESSEAPEATIYIKEEWHKPLREALVEPLRSAYTLARRTAIRVEEMKRLHWSNFDLKARTVMLPGAITKTGKGRLIFLPKDFDLKPGQPDELVFPVGDRREEWREGCVKAGTASMVNGKYVGPMLRNTRHSAIRDLSKAGLEDKRIMEISGHTTRSTLDRYNIKKDGDVKAAAKLLERYNRQQRQAV